ncbi:MAG: 4Fe-4S dicluster domain-containing protein [Bariatricus sp.]|nr:4Fe-4S dicluster domain-containing protein [Bariatricus sp.]
MRRVVCDASLCSGCLACVVACLDQHYDETEVNAVSPRIYEKRKSDKSELVSYITRSCLHCADAPCMENCPMHVFERTENGFVVAAHREKCIGCRKCLQVCQYAIPRYDAEGKIVKCDGCATRVACGLEPACVRACNTGALRLE